MNHRLQLCLSLLIFFITCGTTFATYARQQPAEKTQGAISGHLMSPRKPLSGIKVRLQGPTQLRKGQQTRISDVVTDEWGNFRFDEVAPGSYNVFPITNDYILTDVKYPDRGKFVTVNAEADVVNINLNVVMAARIQGQIKLANGRPIVHRQVSLTRVGSNKYQLNTPFQDYHSIHSDDQGNYTIDHISPGRYVASIGGRAYVSMMFRQSAAKDSLYPLAFYPRATEIAKATVIEVTPGATITGIDITARPIKNLQISGRVVNERTGAPIPRVDLEINFIHPDGSIDSLGNPDWKSDSRGRFRMPVILPGHIYIHGTSSSATNTYSEPIDLGQVKQNVTGLKIKMRRASTLSGQVVFDGGSGTVDPQKISQIRFRLVVNMLDGESAIFFEPTLSPDGHFQIAGLPPGVASLNIEPRIFEVPGKYTVLKVEGGGPDVIDHMNIGKGKDITGLRVIVHESIGSGSVRGQVKIDGLSFDGSEIYVGYQRLKPQSNCCTVLRLDTNGRFVIENLSPGEYEFQIGPAGMRIANEAESKTRQRIPTVKQMVTVTAGAESEVILTGKLNPEK